LALDVGDRRIGVAVGTPEAGLAQPLETITVPRGSADVGEVFRRMREIARHEEAATIVVGDPVNMDGSVGPRAEISRDFARRLQGAMRQARIVLQDERLSSFTADVWMARDGVRPAQRKGRRDAYAAAVILLDYFARLREEESGQQSKGRP
jgi:putative Holliday junction resolvase